MVQHRKSISVVHHIHKTGQKPYDSLNGCRKYIWQSIAPFLIKKSLHCRDRGKMTLYYKNHIKNPEWISSSMGKNWELFRNMTEMSPLTIVVQHSTGSPGLSNQTTKRNKRHPNQQRKSQTFTFRRWLDTLCRKPKRLHPKFARTYTGIQKSVRI